MSTLAGAYGFDANGSPTDEHAETRPRLTVSERTRFLRMMREIEGDDGGEILYATNYGADKAAAHDAGVPLHGEIP